MVGKKKGVSGQKEAGQAEAGEEGKENRDKGERDVARRRGGAPRRGRGASRGRECKFPFIKCLFLGCFISKLHWPPARMYLFVVGWCILLNCTT